MLRSHKQRDFKRARLDPAGSCLAFLVRIQTVDPSAFEMPDAPANEAGVFYLRGRFAGSSLLALADMAIASTNVRVWGKADMTIALRNVC